MKPSMLKAIGSPSYERLGAAPHGAELRGMGENFDEPQEIGRRRLNLWQCACLRWNRSSLETCSACGRAKGALR